MPIVARTQILVHKWDPEQRSVELPSLKVICFEMNEDISLQSRGILQSFVWRGQVHDFGRITFKLAKLPLFNALSPPVSMDIRLLLFF